MGGTVGGVVGVTGPVGVPTGAVGCAALGGIASVLATIAIYTVARFKDPVVVVALLSTTLFFLRWCGLFWCIPSILGTRKRVGFLGGTMNLGGNFAGVGMPIIVGLTGTKGLTLVDQLLTREALTLAVNDVFWLCAVLFLAMIPLLWFAKPPFGSAGGAVGH